MHRRDAHRRIELRLGTGGYDNRTLLVEERDIHPAPLGNERHLLLQLLPAVRPPGVGLQPLLASLNHLLGVVSQLSFLVRKLHLQIDGSGYDGGYKDDGGQKQRQCLGKTDPQAFVNMTPEQ